MDADFWLERWRDGRTHFHQNRITPLLQKYWPTLALPADAKVFVPLCGKSLDMLWIAEQGHYVLGSELSQLAVEQFFDENKLRPTTHDSAAGRHYTAGNIEIICGDIFDLDAATLAGCMGAYDRAALVALPQDMRQRYVDHVYAQLAPKYRGLLLTLDYEQEQMDGPPFAVGDAQVQSLYAQHTDASLIDRRGILDKEPKFAERGLTRLDTLVYTLSRRT
ncbi:thiopurine S-methyltransferase [Pollutimonas thiosulfatoxidans]|uniref:Thiopurine S-methyltransferase n=1 Tax=Pollutimonas thiosulfatoxidans TaxID=2028345 RepID=A0A410GD19_9BURK|nr:thiopurine S-methyltransferase [Pollutimonas thiosulfatoxidans]QAA94175.1 thiopurine S-methyltransferase [Pollutimonas thiosulfatoxidans]